LFAGIAGLDAAMWVPPSRGQTRSTARFPAPSPWRALSARAIASGDPALDYIGTGGPTPLRSA
jgi:hypothetical protein